MSGIENLRKEIQDITESKECYDKVSELIKRFPEEISIHDSNCTYFGRNCYAYALGFGDSGKYIEMCRKQAEKYPEDNGAKSDFISYLVEKEYLEKIINPIENCLVIYFDDKENPKHAGILQKDGEDNDNIIRSKWGNLEAIRTNYNPDGSSYIAGRIPTILAHKLWSVPTDYGTKVKYYKPLSKQESERYFYAFLTNIKGILFDSESSN